MTKKDFSEGVQHLLNNSKILIGVKDGGVTVWKAPTKLSVVTEMEVWPDNLAPAMSSKQEIRIQVEV